MECYVRVDAANFYKGYQNAHRRIVAREIHRVLNSGKVIAGEAFINGGGGHFHVKLDQPEELFGLLGRVLTSTCKVESHPLPPIEME